MYGLYRHKRSFGAEWLELAGAHEQVIRPTRYRVGRVAARAARLLGGALRRGASER
jgi:lipid II:glycine glycyltransferase (peptidoglycan interpeptide bridge formation enzyme)